VQDCDYWGTYNLRIGGKMSHSEGLPKIKPLSNSNYPEWSGEMQAWLMDVQWIVEIGVWEAA
jgi:hypothetical protein